MKYVISFIAGVFGWFVSPAQVNLVLNPSFEQYTHCPDFLDQAKYCQNWSSLDTGWNPADRVHNKSGVPEYCNVCASSYYVSVPQSTYYSHYPRSGNGMMQVAILIDLPDTLLISRDYLQGHLSNNLVRGKTYGLSYYVTLCQSSAYACNNLGAYLDNGTIDTTSHPSWTQSQCHPQVFESRIINDTSHWIKIEDVFAADGSERLLTIGNFFNRGSNSFIAVRDTSGTNGYYETLYLVDDVSVIDCDNKPFAGHDTVIHPGDSVYLGIHEQVVPYTWYQLGSTVPIDSGGGIMVHPTRTTTYVVRQDLCKSQQWDTVTVRVWPDTVTGVAFTQLHEMQMYPNPSHGSLTITGAKGILVSVVDVLGNCVLPQFVAAEPEVLDLVLLAKGVYVVRFTDRVTGEVVVRKVVKE